jgi:DNA sulfur modification protein DndE
MNLPVQTVRLSRQDAEILNGLKRKLKINQWNILCRIAFCISCKDPSPPPRAISRKAESPVEIEWLTFAGPNSEIYNSLLTAHRMNAGPNVDASEYFGRLLSRGIMRLKDEWVNLLA